MMGDLCLSDGIALLLELEYVGWSLFVRLYSSTPGTRVYWVIFICQTAQFYS
jgi:hypothetical protein